ncbi:hypothetical protein ACQR13_21095 [Bradyrhizobium sp. HKCCYLRH3059]|uniref:hypothetical protein n=1 Tax=Bradyrhizobium sp. HKCCYLRH3059 TaxID=3420745 RepID=UPI003EBA5788
MPALDYQLITLIIMIAGGGAGVVWRLTRVETNIRKSIADETRALEDKIAALTGRLAAVEKQNLVDLDVARREIGEAVAAVRTKVHEIETWARDEFVRKNSFELVIARMEKSLETLGDKIDKRLERLTEKIDGRA